MSFASRNASTRTCGSIVHVSVRGPASTALRPGAPSLRRPVMASVTDATASADHHTTDPNTTLSVPTTTSTPATVAPVTFQRNSVSARISVNLSASFSDCSAASR